MISEMWSFCYVQKEVDYEDITWEFWYGNVNPQEQSTEGNLEIKNLLNLMGKNRDILFATLTEDQKETLAKYDDCVNEMYGIIERKKFAYGFRLGGRLILETLTGLNFED